MRRWCTEKEIRLKGGEDNGKNTDTTKYYYHHQMIQSIKILPNYLAVKTPASYFIEFCIFFQLLPKVLLFYVLKILSVINLCLVWWEINML